MDSDRAGASYGIKAETSQYSRAIILVKNAMDDPRFVGKRYPDGVVATERGSNPASVIWARAQSTPDNVVAALVLNGLRHHGLQQGSHLCCRYPVFGDDILMEIVCIPSDFASSQRRFPRVYLLDFSHCRALCWPNRASAEPC